MTTILQAQPTSKRGRLFKNNYVRTFLIGLFLAFLLFTPYIIRDGGRFLFFGDFNVQQVPFYRLAHDAVINGNMGWSSVTDLGANFMGSYAFYLLGSPFFWLTIPFPGDWIPYLMGPLLILKFACAGLTGYIFVRRYVKNQDYAILAGILYAFSGFSVYNIFFNHFHEVIIVFPLLLAAMDDYMENQRRGLFALTVFVCCTVNYYFFVGQVTFCLLYFLLRLATGSYRITLKNFALLLLEALLGFGMSFVILVPAVLSVLQNNRVDNPVSGWNALVYDRPQRYFHIIQCFFFPPDLPARPNFTPDSESKWASLGAWLPLFGMTGVIGWMQQRKKHWLKKMLFILFVCAMIPGLNAAFQLFNGAYYARWFYMLTLMMALATVMALENSRIDWKRSIKWTAAITAAIACAIGFMPREITKEGKQLWVMGLEQYPSRFWSYVAISFISIALLIYLFRYVKKEKFMKNAMISLSIVSVLYGSFFIAAGKTQSQDPYTHFIPYALNGGKNVDLDGLKSVRSDFYKSLDNSGMFWQIPTIQAFHSIIPGSIMDFYKYIGVERGTASRPETDHYGLRGVTSVQWLFDDDHDESYFAGKKYETPAMPGWVYYGNSNGFDIWENQAFIPMGFQYDSYLTQTQAATVGTSSRELLMLKTAIIPDEDEEIWSTLLPKYNLEQAAYTEAAYLEDCAKRKIGACTSFAYTKNGFEAGLDSAKEGVVFFSVPYEDGWRAQVNGERAEILKTNIGFMSVKIPVGDKIRISFTYTTPGLTTGLLITVICLVALVGYCLLMNHIKKTTPPKNPARRLQRRTCRPFASYAAAVSTSFKKREIGGGLRQKGRTPERIGD